MYKDCPNPEKHLHLEEINEPRIKVHDNFSPLTPFQINNMSPNELMEKIHQSSLKKQILIAKQIEGSKLLEFNGVDLYEISFLYIQNNTITNAIAGHIAETINEADPRHCLSDYFIKWLKILHQNKFVDNSFIMNIMTKFYDYLTVPSKAIAYEIIIQIATEENNEFIRLLNVEDFTELSSYQQIDQFLCILERSKYENYELFSLLMNKLNDTDFINKINERVKNHELDKDVLLIIDNFMEQVE